MGFEMPDIADKSSLSCLVFSDLVGSTALKAELGDEAAGSLIARHHAHVRRLLRETAGREVDCAGDGFFLTFAAPSSAVSFGLRLQQVHAAEPDLPAVRIGIHLGEVTERPAPPESSKTTLVEGLAVDVASRIGSLALPGQLLMSSAVLEAARQRLRAEDLGTEVRWVAYGPYRFKGVETPVEIAEAGFDRTSSLTAPPDSEKAWRIDRPGNLPSLLPTFVGRERELETLHELLGSHRLVTVVGPAGTGKTRTAIQAASAAAPGFRGGVWLVELGPESELRAVLGAVARSLSIAPEPRVPLLDAVVDALRYRPTLLLLDNCEHLLGSAAELADQLLRSCPELRVIATSREPLRCRAEQVFALDPMPTESPASGASDAVALFIERACSEGAAMEQLEEERAAIEELCARLDGLPLAIELAATRARSVGPRQLATLMGERFRVLKASRRPADARHQTLRSAIDSSYEVLEASERALFDCLSLFAGPFEVVDAMAVAADGESDELDTLDRLSGLVDRSMVVALPGRLPTYRLLETLAAYGAERLESSHEAGDVQRHHAEHFATKAEAARSEVVGPRHVAVVDLLIAQVAEYRAAATWACAAGDLDLAVRLAAGFCGASYFRIGYDALDWLGPDPASAALAGRPMSIELLGLLARRAIFSGNIQLGRELAERAIAMDPGPESMQARAQMALISPDRTAIEWAQGALDVAERASDHLGVLIGCLVMGPILARLRRVDEALEIGRRLFALGDQRDSEHARGWGHLVLGSALSSKDPERARQHLETATRLGRAEKNRYLQSNALIAELAMHLASDSPAGAAAAAHRTLLQMREAGDSVFFTRRVLGQIAIFLAAHGRSEWCVLDGYLGRPSESGADTRLSRGRAAALQQLAVELGETAVESLGERGAGLSADDAIEVATRALQEIA